MQEIWAWLMSVQPDGLLLLVLGAAIYLYLVDVAARQRERWRERRWRDD